MFGGWFFCNNTYTCYKFGLDAFGAFVVSSLAKKPTFQLVAVGCVAGSVLNAHYFLNLFFKLKLRPWYVREQRLFCVLHGLPVSVLLINSFPKPEPTQWLNGKGAGANKVECGSIPVTERHG